MRNKPVILLSCAIAALLLRPGIAAAQERLAPIFPTPVTPTFSFGMIGIGTGQTLRINVLNLVRTPPPVAVSIAQIPCKVDFNIYDGQGKLVKQKTVANLGFGQADFLELARTDLPATPAHVSVSGVVSVGSTQAFFCNISTTLEIFDSVTGATAAVLTGPISTPAFVAPVPLSVLQPQQP